MSAADVWPSTVAALKAVRFNEHGTPDRPLPDCPRCEENELHVSAYDCTAICLQCGWRCEWARQLDG